MTTGRVFVVQRPAYFDRQRRGWVNKYDLTPAQVFGELVFLLKPGNLYRSHMAETIAYLQQQLASFGDADHILSVGDPVAIAMTVLLAGQANDGKVSLLKFDRVSETYGAYIVDARPNDG